MMKVFKMDDCDWVAANTIEEATEFYLKETGVEREEINPQEISLNACMWVEYWEDDVRDIIDGPRNEVFNHKGMELMRMGYSVYRRLTLEEVLKNGNHKEPFIIASTEL